MGPLVSVRGLSKRFGAVEALAGVDLEVAPGEIVALVGPNGAGKTTLLKSVAGLLIPDAGSVEVRGRPAYCGAGERTLFWRLSPEQNLRYFAGLSGLCAADSRERVGRVLSDFSLNGERKRPVGTASSGIRQRAGLARMFVAPEEVLVFDEPVQNLDAESAARLWARLRGEARSGRAVLVATHRLEDAEAHADRVLRFEEGRIVETRVPTKEVPKTPSPLAGEGWGGGYESPLRLFLRQVLAVFRKEAALAASQRGALALRLAQAALGLAGFYFMGRLVGSSPRLIAYGGAYFPFVLVWLAFQPLQTAVLSGFASEIRTGQLTGTLETAASARPGLLVVLSLSVLWRLMVALATGGGLFAAGAFLSGGFPEAARWGTVLAAAAPMAGFLAGLGLASGGAVLVYRGGTPLVSAYSAVSMLLSGALYPVEVLPAALARLADFFPLTLFLRVAREAVLAGSGASWRDLAVLGGWAVSGVGLGLAAFCWGLRAARKRGTLSHY